MNFEDVIHGSWLTFLEDITHNKQTSQTGLGKTTSVKWPL